MAQEIFISYSVKDQGMADTVCAMLEGAGISCWIAPRNITPGIKYAEAIVDAINHCRIFLLVLSSSSNASAQVEMEVDRAASKAINILSFRIDNVVLSKSMEYYLSSRHWLDASKPPIEKHLQSLIQTVSQLLGKQGETQAPTVERDSHPGVRSVSPQPDFEPSAPAPTLKVAAPFASLNPFTFGNPIKDPERFIGRQTEIRQITNRLLSSAHESTSIIGERRIGKTSLLNYLAHPEVSARLGLTSDRFCLIYVDFQGLTDITPTRFWQRVLKKMSRSVCEKSLLPAIQELINLEQFDLFDLEDLFEAFTDKGLTTVLFMDEFEYVTQNPNFKGDFFGGLRALAIHHGVALIPATRRELVDLCHSEEIKGSPFFNIFANVVLRPFSRLEVDEMLCTYLQDAEFSCSTEEQEFIWKLGGGYPFFVQMAGHYLVEGKLQNLNGEALTKFTSTSFDGQADGHFTYLWSHCSESEKIALLVILTLGLQKQSKKTVPNAENLARLRPRAPQDVTSLGKRGLVDERNAIYSLFSPSFEKWIRREIVTAPGEEESQTSAVEWLKSGGHSDLKEVKGVLPKFKKKYWPILGDIAKELSFEFAAAGTMEIIKLLV